MCTRVILVVLAPKKRFYVITEAKFDKDWKQQAADHVKCKDSRYCFERSKALTLAHDMQRKDKHDGGVWEVRLNSSDVHTKPIGPEKKSDDTKDAPVVPIQSQAP